MILLLGDTSKSFQGDNSMGFPSAGEGDPLTALRETSLGLQLLLGPDFAVEPVAPGCPCAFPSGGIMDNGVGWDEPGTCHCGVCPLLWGLSTAVR